MNDDDIYKYLIEGLDKSTIVRTRNNTTTKWSPYSTATSPSAELEKLHQIINEQNKHVNSRISALEDQIALVRRDVCMEKEFEELKEAWEAYNYMLEKLRTFKIIKDSVNNGGDI